MSRIPPKSLSEMENIEEKYKKKLEMEEKLGRKEGMADAYGNLGIIYLTLGHLDNAEEMFKKSLELEEELADKEGMASDYGYLGTIYQTRSNLEQAEIMYKKSLEINQSLGRKEVWQRYMANLVKFTIPVVIWIKPRTCLKKVWKLK